MFQLDLPSSQGRAGELFDIGGPAGMLANFIASHCELHDLGIVPSTELWNEYLVAVPHRLRYKRKELFEILRDMGLGKFQTMDGHDQFIGITLKSNPRAWGIRAKSYVDSGNRWARPGLDGDPQGL